MTDREKVKKELRKAIRNVFMKYKREGLWKSNGEYVYNYDYFLLPFSLDYKEKKYNKNYVYFNYTNGSALIRVDPQLYYDMPSEYSELIAKTDEVVKEMHSATIFWGSIYKIKFTRKT